MYFVLYYEKFYALYYFTNTGACIITNTKWKTQVTSSNNHSQQVVSYGKREARNTHQLVSFIRGRFEDSTPNETDRNGKFMH